MDERTVDNLHAEPLPDPADEPSELPPFNPCGARFFRARRGPRCGAGGARGGAPRAGRTAALAPRQGV